MVFNESLDIYVFPDYNCQLHITRIQHTLLLVPITPGFSQYFSYRFFFQYIFPINVCIIGMVPVLKFRASINI